MKKIYLLNKYLNREIGQLHITIIENPVTKNTYK